MLGRSKKSGGWEDWGEQIHLGVGVESFPGLLQAWKRIRWLGWSLEKSGFCQRDDEELGANWNGEEQTRSLTPPPPACEQQGEADALLSLDDLIRLLPSCLPRKKSLCSPWQALPSAGFRVPGHF